MHTKQDKKWAVWMVFAVVFFDLFRFGIAFPILTPLFLNNPTGLFDPASSFGERSMLLGILIALHPISQFFGAPILGSLSDRYGRKPLLIFSYIGTLVSLIMTAGGIEANSLVLIFLGRILGGFTGGNVSVAQSAMADISTPAEKVQNFSLISTAFGLGLIFGPFIGGKLADPELVSWFNFATPFWVAAVITLINTLFVWRAFKETLVNKVHKKVTAFTGIVNLKRAWDPALRMILIVTFFNILGFNFFNQFFQISMVSKFHLDQGEIGELLGYQGLCLVLAQIFIVRNLSKRFNAFQVLNVSLLLSAISMLSYLLINQWQLFFVTLPFTLSLLALNNPNTLSLLSNSAPNNEQGEVLGIRQSIQALAMSIPPIITGILVAIDMNFPVIASAILLFISWIMFIRIKHRPKALSIE